MKRIKTMLMAMIALFAIGAMGASSASAATGEIQVDLGTTCQFDTLLSADPISVPEGSTTTLDDDSIGLDCPSISSGRLIDPLDVTPTSGTAGSPGGAVFEPTGASSRIRVSVPILGNCEVTLWQPVTLPETPGGSNHYASDNTPAGVPWFEVSGGTTSGSAPSAPHVATDNGGSLCPTQPYRVDGVLIAD